MKSRASKLLDKMEGGFGSAKETASAVARALAKWSEKQLKDLVISVDGKKNIPGVIKKAIKAVEKDGLIDKAAFGIKDLKAGALIQLKKSESYTISEDSQKGRVSMIIDMDFVGIIPHKDELKKLFKKHKENMLKAMDKEFKALGFSKNDEE